MAFYNPKQGFHSCSEDEDSGKSDRPSSTKGLHDQEKRMRREIANSNERRRMQNINAGLQSLKELLPFRGAKLSKVAILQGATEYLHQLEQDNTRLFLQFSQLSKEHESCMNNSDCGSSSDSPEPIRKRRKTVDSVDEGIGSSGSPRRNSSPEEELARLKRMLRQERAYRVSLEEQVKNLEFRLSQPNEVKRSVLVMNSGVESGISSPRSQLSSQDFDLSLLGSSPEHSSLENAEPPALSVIKSSPASRDTSIVEASNSVTASVTKDACSDESCRETVLGRAGQNLFTILEAIKHVEGLDVFCSNLQSVESK